jgi:hypothetical protein
LLADRHQPGESVASSAIASVELNCTTYVVRDRIAGVPLAGRHLDDPENHCKEQQQLAAVEAR